MSKWSLKRLKPLNDLFKKAVYYSSHRLLKKSVRYDAQVAKKIGHYHKRLDVQLRRGRFSGSDPIAVLDFLQRFNTACDHNGMTE